MDMSDKLKEQFEKKLKEGWIHSWMMIEVLAVSEEAATSALEQHIAMLDREKKTFLYRKEFKDVKKIENPLPNLPVGYSYLVEIEVLTENYETLLYLVMNYGPTATEILHPEKIAINTGEAQAIVNSVADVIHKFAQQGLGGIIIKS